MSRGAFVLVLGEIMDGRILSISAQLSGVLRLMYVVEYRLEFCWSIPM